MVTVNKNLGEHVTNNYNFRFKKRSNPVNVFVENRTNFIKYLKHNNYKTYTKGNYITADNTKENNTFFFLSHMNYNKNYLIPKTLENRINYFAFYDENTNDVYLVSYGKVREYCNSLTDSYFFNKNEKLLIPDTWAKEQRINKITL